MTPQLGGRIHTFGDGVVSGLSAGASAGFVANLLLTVLVFVGALVDGGEPGFALLVLIIGTPIAIAVGALAGAIAGSFLAVLDKPDLAPWFFAPIAAAFPGAFAVLSASDSWVFRAFYAIIAACFGAVGYLAGNTFSISVFRKSEARRFR